MTTKSKHRVHTPTFTGSAELWKTLLRGVPEFACILDDHGRFLFVNRLLPQLKLEDVIGKPVYDFLAPESRDSYRRNFEQVSKTGEPRLFQVQGLTAKGMGFYENHIAPIQDEKGGKLFACVSRDITDRKKIFARLQETEDLFEEMFESCREGIAFADADGLLLRVNPAYSKISGYSRAQLEGKKRFRDITAPEYHKSDRGISERLLKSGGSAEFEKEWVRPDGSRVWVQLTVYGVPSTKDQPARFHGFVRDITALKRAEEAQRQHEGLLQLMQSAAAGANEATSSSEALLGCLDAVCRYTGWPVGHAYLVPDDGRGLAEPTTIWHLDEPERCESFRQLTERTSFQRGKGLPGQVWESGEPVWIHDVRTDRNFPRSDAARRAGLVSAFGFPVLVGGHVAAILEFFCFEPKPASAQLLGVLRFLGLQLSRSIERERSRVELQRREELLRLLVAGVQDYAIFMLDPQARIVSWNEGAARIFGHGAEQVLGRALSFLYPEKERVDAENLTRVAVEDGRAEAEAWQRRRDASPFWANIVVTALRDEAGGLRGFACVTRDITERKRMEREVLEAGAREQRRIAQDLHDSLGQKLTGIALIAQVLEGRLAAKNAPEAEDARKIAGYSTEAVREARELAQGLLPAELGGGLPEALKSLASYSREALGVECDAKCERGIEAPDDLAAVHLYRIAQEAVHNAVRHGKARRVELSLTEGGGRLLLTIQDDGTGIPPQRRRKAGLGLGIMQYRARMMGASLDVRRGRGSGTIVVCAVPRPT